MVDSLHRLGDAQDAARRPIILVVEDEVIVARDIQTRLVASGYDVPITVGSGSQAIQEAARIRPDLVIIDVGLTGEIDGIEAARLMRERLDIPIIFATAYSDDGTLQRAKVADPFGYVLKPYEARDLRTVVEMALYKFKTDRLLRESEERYRLLFRSSPVGVFHFGADGVITEANARILSILRRDQPQVVGRPAAEAFDAPIQEAVRKALRGEVGWYEGRFASTAPSDPWVSVQTAPLRDQTGRVIGGVGILEDMSERRKVEEALVHRVNFEDLIAGLSARLMNLEAGQLIPAIDHALNAIGGFMRADRCFVKLFRPGSSIVEREFQWSGLPAAHPPARRRGFSYESMPWMMHRLRSGESLCLHRVSDFPSDASTEREFWSAEGVRSLLLLPLSVLGKLTGVFGLTTEKAERIWAGEDLRLLSLVGKILAAVFAREQAHDTLQRSEERYRRITTEVTDYIYTVRLLRGQWSDTTHGPGCAAVTGYAAEEYRRDPELWLRMVDERDRHAVLEQLRRVLAGEPVPPIEHRIIRKDGVRRWVRNTPVLHFTAQGDLISYDGLVQDITERKEAEEALRQSEERYRVLVDNLDDVIFSLDPRGYFTYISTPVEHLLGYSARELVGEHFTRFIHPHERAKVLGEWERTLAGQTGHHEFRVLTKDGNELHVRMSSRVRMEGGEVVCISGVLTDITERKKAEQHLRESEQRYRDILENIGFAAVMVDVQGAVVFCNNYFLRCVGRRKLELLGKKFVDECVPERDRSLAHSILLAPIRQGAMPGTFVLSLLSSSGSTHAFEWKTTGMRDLDGNIAGVTCLGRDVSGAEPQRENF